MRLRGVTQLNPYDIELIGQAIQYIIHKYPAYISAEDLSGEVGLDIKKLQAGFKKVTGLTVHQYQINTRIERAKSDLADFSLSVKMVSFRNGFKNKSHFANLFKKHVGQSPTDYRIRIMNKDNPLRGDTRND